MTPPKSQYKTSLYLNCLHNLKIEVKTLFTSRVITRIGALAIRMFPEHMPVQLTGPHEWFVCAYTTAKPLRYFSSGNIGR